MKKIVTARKEYSCDYCNSLIKKGDKYIFGEGRDPKYDGDNIDNLKQTGIAYYRYRICLRHKRYKLKELP
jgi:hypothetical protein